MNYNTCVICLGHPQPDVTVVRLRTAVKTSLTTPLSASRNSGLCQRASKSKLSLRFMEMELGLSKDLIYLTLTYHLIYWKVCAHFLPHKVTNDQKLFKIQDWKDIVIEGKRDENFLRNIGWWRNVMFPIQFGNKASEFWMEAKKRAEKSKVKAMLISFHTAKSIVHDEFVPPPTQVTAPFYFGVLKPSLHCIWHMRPE